MSRIAIRGGQLIDGTGAPAVRADVGIEDGRIVEIAREVKAPKEIDASGRLVTPGFIDMHTHYDPQVLWDPALTPSSLQGVTSVAAGSCGYSIAPIRSEVAGTLLRTLDKVEDMPLETLEAGIEWNFESYGEYLGVIEKRGTAINFGGYVGHTPVRLCVLGDEAYERHATEVELVRMKELVADSIRAGALGFSSDRAGFHVGDGGRPVPSIAASQEELEALAGVTGEIGQGVVHLAPGENFEWIYEFQRQLERPLNWSSILTYPESWTSRAPFRGKLEQHVAGRSTGADVWVQVTCRPIVQQVKMLEPTPFYQMPAFAAMSAVPAVERRRFYSDSEWRARAWREFESRKWVDGRWDTFLVAESDIHTDLVGRSVQSIANERGCTPFDAICDLALAEQLETRFSITFANDDEEGVALLLLGEGCVLGLSDAGAHTGQICDAVLATDFLANWVRDRELMPVERGIHKLTGELADVLRLDRGTLRPGAPADVLVLDYENLSPGPIRRVRDLPANGDRLTADAPTGIDYVLVNGVPICSEGKPIADQLDALPGSILRSTPD